MKQVTNFNEISTAVNLNGDMIITAVNGKIFIMDKKEYNEQKTKQEIETHLLKAEKDIEDGKYRDADEVFKKWDEKYRV